jgi:probable F420-dependent oxidoreductase
MSLRVGVIYPQNELGVDPGNLRAFAQESEAAGFDHLLLYEHVLGVNPEGRIPPLIGSHTLDDAFHEPLTAFAYIAACCERLELVTGVLVLPQRQTALVAKQAAEVSNLSKGRLRLGVGSGWNHAEFEGLGVDFSTRGIRLDEQIQLLRMLWSSPEIDFEGQFHRIQKAGINPLPVVAPSIWVGGQTVPAWRRGARLGDGFIFIDRSPGRADASEQWLRVQEFLVNEGREPGSFGSDISIRYGDASSVADQIHDWVERKGTHVTVASNGRGFETVQEHLAFVCRVKELYENA